MRKVTPIQTDERGNETHPSWIVMRANRFSSSPPGAALFGSDIRHQHAVSVEIARCSRQRDLNRDWIHSEQILLEAWMSQAQWGAFVSSFGEGTGVPATLRYGRDGALVEIPSAPFESRFDESHAEVREAGEKAFEDVKEGYAAVIEAFENGGRRALREALRTLGSRIENAPKNMEFAAESLTEHVEKVRTTAKADIEAMIQMAEERGALDSVPVPELGSGEER